MSYLLDTNVCINLINNRNLKVAQRLATHRPQDIFICTIVAFELYYGAYRSSRKEGNLKILERFFNEFTILR